MNRADRLPMASFPSEAGETYRAGSRKSGGVGGAICPRCTTFIASTSRVVRLWSPERPNSTDGRKDTSTGRYYRADGRPISMKPRWWVHERCYKRGAK